MAPTNNFLLFIIVLALSMATIPLCKKLIPWFVAQKDLINRRVKTEL